MSATAFARLRSLVLLAALTVGLLGQVFAPTAMAMSAPMPTVRAAVASAANPQPCPACPRQNGTPASPMAMPGCLLGLCSLSPALLPQALTVVAPPRAKFQASLFHGEAGISIRPDLGPPKPTRHD